MAKVFLGGTCMSSWRDDFKSLLDKLEIDYFDPVVDDWNDEAQTREDQEKEKSDFNLYIISPKMTGVYSIAEAVDDSNKTPEKTLFCFLIADEEDVFTQGQVRSLTAVARIIRANGGNVFGNLIEVAVYLKAYYEKEI